MGAHATAPVPASIILERLNTRHRQIFTLGWLLARLRKHSFGITAPLLEDTAAFAEREPDVFQRSPDTLIGDILRGKFSPATATAFIEKLNDA